MARSSTVVASEITSKFTVGAREGSIAQERGTANDDYPHQLKRANDGSFFTTTYKWSADTIVCIAFVLPIILGTLLSTAAVAGLIYGAKSWLTAKRQMVIGQFKHLEAYGSVSVTNDNFIVRIKKDGDYGKAYVRTVRDFYESWGCTPPTAYVDGTMTDEMKEVLHDTYLCDPFNNVSDSSSLCTLLSVTCQSY